MATATLPPPPTLLPSPTTTTLRALFTPERLHDTLLPRERWTPFPAASDRAAWQALSAAERQRLVAAAEPHLGMAWPALPASTFLEFRRNGNRSRFEAPHFERRLALIHLVLAECVEGRGRFLDDIVNGIWAICEESFWGVSAHNARHSPRFQGSALPDTSFHEVDLFAAETGALLAWTHYLLAPQLSVELPVVADRIEREVRARILEPYRSVDVWNWLGKVRRPVNNWNPWIHSNILACNLLLERDATSRESTVHRIVEGLDTFLDGYHADGGCDEGTSYWGRAGASLFDCLETLRTATNGQLDGFQIPLVQEIGRYIYRMHIDDSWYVNFADGSAKNVIEGGLVYRYGKRIADPKMMAQGAYAVRHTHQRPGRGSSIARVMGALFEPVPEQERDVRPPYIRQHWFDGIQVLVAREQDGTPQGLFLAAKGGHNAESHNHNDVGHFVVALDGHPVLIDVGVETYTRQTFGPERYTIWTMQSAYHNLPLVNGVHQAAGREFAARDVSAHVEDESAALTLDIAGAYPPEAGIQRWQRTSRLERAGRAGGARIVIEDAYDLAAAPQSLALHVMTSGAVDTSEPGVLRCDAPSRPLLVRYDPAVFAANTEAVSTRGDGRLTPVWGERVYRTMLTVKQPGRSGGWTLTASA